MDEEQQYGLVDYLIYRKSLNDSLEQPELRKKIFYNDSYVHAAMVVEAIIRHAIKEQLQVKMYCGEFSIFRDKYREIIRKLKDRIRPIGDSTEMILTWQQFNPYDDLVKTLSEYLQLENSHFQLLVEKDITDIKNEYVWGIVSQSVQSGRLKISSITEKTGVSHFIVAGNAYRKESSDKMKTAICCLDDEETATVLNDNFKTLKQKKNVQLFVSDESLG